MIKELNVEIDHSRLLQVVHDLNILESTSSKYEPQISVQRREETLPKFQLSESCNSLIYNWDTYDSKIHNSLEKREVVLKEEDFTITCDLFKGTYLETVIDILNKEYGVYRGRFMLMRYKTCLSMHTDDSCRIHIPLITNPYSFMVIADKVFRLQANKVYLADTTFEHTAVNSGRYDRLHLVFCTNAKL
jgi:hypothetical protein